MVKKNDLGLRESLLPQRELDTRVFYYMIQHLVKKEFQLLTSIIQDAWENETTFVGVYSS